MRILLSAYACEPGKGSEPGVGWNWALELARQGHNVTVLTRANNVETIAPALSSLEALPLKFVYYDLPRWLRWWKKGGRGVHLYYQLWQIGVYCVARRLTRLETFDVAHHLTFGVFRQPSWLGSLGIPFVLGPIGGGEKTPDSLVSTYGLRGRIGESARRIANRTAVLHPAVRSMFSRACIILCRNQQTLQAVPKRYRHKCLVDPEDSVEPEWISETVKAPERCGFLFVGRFIYLKGIHLAMDALAVAVKHRPDVKLILVGNGPQLKELKEQAKQLQITRSVEWHSWMSQTELREFYRSSAALVFPSMRDSGGTVVRESLASGTPVICLNTGGPGVIVPEDAGFKIECEGRTRDQVVSDLAEAMLALANDSKLAARMSRNAIEFARAHTWQAAVKRAYAVVEERLNLPPAPLARRNRKENNRAHAREPRRSPVNITKSTLIGENACDTQHALRVVYSGEPCPNQERRLLLAIGRKGEIRWLVEPRAKRTADSVWKSWIPYSGKARIAWAVLRWSLKIGAIRFMPGVSSIEIPPNSFGQWIERAPELKDRAVVIFIGKPSITQKLTIFVGDEKGELSAVVKLPLTDNAIASIDNEANALRQLQGIVPGIPKLISPPSADGVCIEDWVDGKSTERRITEKHLSLLLTLPRTGRNTRLRDRFEELVPRLSMEHRHIAQQFIPAIEDNRWNGELPEVWEHGDFAPWNLKESPAGHLTLIDWEYASRDGLPLLDLLHFFYRQEYLFRDTGNLRRGIEENEYVKEYCRIFGLSMAAQRDLARYYLVRSLLYDIPRLGPQDTYESFVATQLESIGQHNTIEKSLAFL